jgi:non-ribosomal peptide synthase protein (TIGR01720 family)
MLPSIYVPLEKIPLTLNGKVDYKALPDVDSINRQTLNYQAPVTQVEQSLCAIWQGALRIDEIGVNDNFFTLGGDSIIAIQVVTKARNAGLTLTVKALFEYKTISKLAPYIGTADEQSLAPQQPVEGVLPLLPISHYFFAMELPEQHHFNQSVMLETPANFESAHLTQLMSAFYQRHDALRLVFNQHKQQQGWIAEHQAFTEQMVNDSIEVLQLPVQAEQQKDFIVSHANQYQAQFNLASGPLFKALLFEQPAINKETDKGRLCLICHHLVVDGVSWRILLADLKIAWQQLSQGSPIQLAPKTSSVKQWIDALTDYTHSNQADSALTQERDYWIAQLTLPVASQITNQRQQPLQVAQPEPLLSCELRLAAKQTQSLLGHCNEAYLTSINELLLSALLNAWQQYSGQNVLRLEMESHGREELFESIDVSETVGWFTALYPQIVHCQANDSLDQQIKQVKEQYRALPNKGIGFGLLKYLRQDPQILALKGDNNQGAVVFNYLGQFDASLGEEQLFAHAREATGYNSNINQSQQGLLAINGMVTDQQLSFSITYLDSRISTQAVENLADLFKQALLGVIEHCEHKITQISLYEQASSLIVNPQESLLDEGIEI